MIFLNPSLLLGIFNGEHDNALVKRSSSNTLGASDLDTLSDIIGMKINCLNQLPSLIDAPMSELEVSPGGQPELLLG